MLQATSAARSWTRIRAFMSVMGGRRRRGRGKDSSRKESMLRDWVRVRVWLLG